MDDFEIRRILFATDFSEYSNKARNYAIGMARAFGASVEVLHTVESIYDLDQDPELSQWLRNLENNMRKELEKEMEHFRGQGIEVSGKLETGVPWEKALQAADASGADVIVVGSHGMRTREGRFLLGTTSHKIALASRVPVLIVRDER